MKVIRNIHKVNAEAPHLPKGNFLDGRIGFWGIVKEVNSCSQIAETKPKRFHNTIKIELEIQQSCRIKN